MDRTYKLSTICIFLLFFSIFDYSNSFASEEDETKNNLQLYKTNIKIIETLARLEEGQKSIINEMRTQFKAVDERFESVDKRFESLTREMDKRFESLMREMNKRFEAADKRFEYLTREMNKRFEAVDKRFESLTREMNERFESLTREMNERFEAVDKRFESLTREMNERFESSNKRMDQQNTYFIAILAAFVSIFVAIIGFAVWDRKNDIAKIQEEKRLAIEKEAHINESSMALKAYESYQEVIKLMRKMSENMPEMRSMMQSANLL
ncbi:conserved hypothetical protein, secreted [Candidatus Magnetomorum sp. HK-1]|nr:conserved hypothetical protein, secreted [Candidatus Magnetomorum sp. HK-1]